MPKPTTPRDFLTTPQFTQAEVLATTGLSKAVLQTWITRRLIEIADHNPGTGKRRQYSAADVCLLSLIATMTPFGISVSAAEDIARQAMSWCWGATDLSNIIASTVVVVRLRTDGTLDWALIQDAPEDVSLSRVLGQEARSEAALAPALVLPIGSIVAAVLRRLKGIRDNDF